MNDEKLDGALKLVPDSDDSFFQRGKDWESDREEKNRKNRVLGWRLFYLMTACFLITMIAVVILVLRHQPEPFMITVDKATGQTSTILPAKDARVNLTEIEVKHDINRYILARESYFYPLLQRNYDLTLLMSCSDPEHQVAQEYDKQFGGDKGLDKVLGANTEYRVEVLSIRLPNDEPGKAVVSFVKTIYHGLQVDPNSKPSRNVVTLSYKNDFKLLAKENEWIENPRAFKVCAYRVDPELSTGGN